MKSKRTTSIAILAIVLASPAGLFAQGLGSSLPGGIPQSASALTGDQQSAANSALCSALASNVPNPASAGPSALSNPSGVIRCGPGLCRQHESSAAQRDRYVEVLYRAACH